MTITVLEKMWEEFGDILIHSEMKLKLIFIG